MSTSFIPERGFTLRRERLHSIALRKERFCYDVRGNSYVTFDPVAAYHVPSGADELPDLQTVPAHALEHDAIVSGHRFPDGRIRYTSCRLFTDHAERESFSGLQVRQQNGAARGGPGHLP
ncbi:MAG: hypothetical protein IPP83_05265 [Flavobacteriales bacterium]|nr:hypothetical protein [Flavobacteriales bacterium]